MVYSTYLGGSGIDQGRAIAVDGEGNAYVTGNTASTDFPITTGAFQKALAGGRSVDAFIVKVSPDGALIYSTYLGGGQPEFDAFDYGNSVAVDSLGNAYVAGRTGSTDFPVTPGALKRTLYTPNGGIARNAFVTKINAAGSSLLYSTYLGGSGYEEALGIALDAAGNAFVTGYTGSSDFPVTAGAFQTEHARDPTSFSIFEDAFVSKLNTDGSALVYSTYLGGARGDRGNAIAVDEAGNAYVSGVTSSFNFPTSVDALKRDFGGGFYKSGNGGRQWQASNEGLLTPTPRTIAVDPKVSGHLYLATDDGLFDSFNSGNSWSRVSEIRLSYLIIDPLNPAVLYANGAAGIVKSSDGGVTWAPSNKGLAPVSTFKLLIDPLQTSTLYVIAYGAFTNQLEATEPSYRAPRISDGPPGPRASLFKSSDAGATWNQINSAPNLELGALVIDPRDPSRLFLLTGLHFLFRTQDRGGTWQLMNSQGYPPLAVDPTTPGTLYGQGFSLGLAKSTDDGVTWVDKGGDPPGLRGLLALPTTPTTLYASTQNGIFKSTDAGEKWEASNIDGDIAFIAGDALDTSAVYTGVNDRQDAFVVKLNASGSALVYATYLGGLSTDDAQSIALDSAGNAYVTGLTGSSTFPTLNALQANRPTSPSAFLAKLNVTGSKLLYSTYLGGNDHTTAHAVVVRRGGEVYLAGETAAKNFIIKGAFQSDLAGQVDAFIMKFAAPVVSGVVISGKRMIVNGSGFDEGATILVNGETRETKSDASNATNVLIAKKGAKQIAPGQTVIVQVRNGDGALSNELRFTRAVQ